VRLWTSTLRVRFLGIDEREGRLPKNPVGIAVFWHQRILAFAGIYHHAGVKAIVSQHGDGEMLARIMLRLGIRPIRGSTTRGGASALREILRDPEERPFIAITPDGPRGPRHFFHEGAVYLASRTGLPLYFVTASFRRYLRLPTWDGFVVPCPFTRTILRLADRIDVPPDVTREELERIRKDAEDRLRAITDATDRDFEALYGAARSIRDLPPAADAACEAGRVA
jgi:hypothetical protein